MFAGCNAPSRGFSAPLPGCLPRARRSTTAVTRGENCGPDKTAPPVTQGVLTVFDSMSRFRKTCRLLLGRKAAPWHKNMGVTLNDLRIKAESCGFRRGAAAKLPRRKDRARSRPRPGPEVVDRTPPV